MKKDVDNKLDIYKLTTSEELLKYYQDWTKKNNNNLIGEKNEQEFNRET